jgi:polar amino acid transport system substrate-binding protein
MKYCLAIWLVLCALCGGTGAQAADIAVFSGDGSPPKMYLQDGKSRGILVDILQYADQHMPQHQFQVKLFPWARAYQQALVGRGGVAGLSWTHRRDDLFDYSEPLFFDEVVIVVRKGHEFRFNSIDDLKGKRLGVVHGAAFGEAFDKAQKAGFFIVDGDSGAQNRIQKLLRGRIDCALFNVGKVGFEEALRINNVFSTLKDKLVVLPVPFRKDPNFLAFPKSLKMKPWLAEFDEVIKKGYARGDIQKIVEQNLNDYQYADRLPVSGFFAKAR